jgi:hypothetical protein
MTRRNTAAAVLIVITGVLVYFWLRPPSPNQPSASETQASQDAAVAKALTAQSTNTTAIIASNFAGVQPAPENSASSTSAASSAPSGPASPLQFTDIPPSIVLENTARAIRQYGAMFGGNPVGNNAEITGQLNGNNPRHINFINAGSGMRLNENGELIDPWGTPYFFHQISGADTEIHSAGPDKIMWTSDDLVTR